MEAHPEMGHGKAWVYSIVWGTLWVLKKCVLLYKATLGLELVASPDCEVVVYILNSAALDLSTRTWRDHTIAPAC